jgi:LysM repeat protein
MEASSGDRKPTSWTARILAPVLLVVVAAAIVLIVSGTLNSDDGSSSEPREQTSDGGGCSPPDEIKAAVKDGYYVVVAGDNFSTIADKTCVSEDRLQQLNPNLDPFGLQVQNCVDLVTDGCKALAGG